MKQTNDLLLDAVFVLSVDCYVQELADEKRKTIRIISSVDENQYYELDLIAAELLLAMKESAPSRKTLRSVIDALVEQYGVEQRQLIEEKSVEIVVQLCSKGILCKRG